MQICINRFYRLSLISIDVDHVGRLAPLRVHYACERTCFRAVGLLDALSTLVPDSTTGAAPFSARWCRSSHHRKNMSTLSICLQQCGVHLKSAISPARNARAQEYCQFVLLGKRIARQPEGEGGKSDA